MEAIGESGWGAVSTRHVARLAGVNQALVHYHFGSIAALLRSAAVHALESAASPAVAALMEAPDLRAGIAACLREIERIDPEAKSSLVIGEAMMQATRDAELAALLRPSLAGFRSSIEQRAAAEGSPIPAAAAVAVAAALDGLWLHRMIDPNLDVKVAAGSLTAALALPAKRPAARRPPRAKTNSGRRTP